MIDHPALTPHEYHRLTLFKWRYSLEFIGFTRAQAGRLLFLRWLYIWGYTQEG